MPYKALRSKVSLSLLAFSVPAFSSVLLFQNCSSMSAFKSAPPAGTSYCNDLPSDPACQKAAGVWCVFNGQSLAEGQTVTAFLNSSEPTGTACRSQARVCHAGIISGSYSYASCSTKPAACLFNGLTIASGQSVTAYLNSTDNGQTSCTSQVRACTNGALTGTYNYATCVHGTTASCIFDGKTVAHGSSVTAYANSQVAYGKQCQPLVRTCYNGALSGAGTFSSCTVAAAASCLFNGQTIVSGQATSAYDVSHVPYGQSCQAQTRVCTDGTLSGAGAYASCAVDQPASCLLDGQTIPHGGQVTAYFQNAVMNPAGSCATEVRTCSNGVLSGSAAYTSCTVQTSRVVVYQQPTITDGIDNHISYAGDPKSPILDKTIFWVTATLAPDSAYTNATILSQPIGWPAGDFTGFYPSDPVAMQRGANPNGYGSVTVQAEGDTLGAILSPSTVGCCDLSNSYPSALLGVLHGLSQPALPWAQNNDIKLRFSGEFKVPRADRRNDAHNLLFAQLWINELPTICDGNGQNCHCQSEGGICRTTQLVTELFNQGQSQYSSGGTYGGDPRVGSANDIIGARLNSGLPYPTALLGSMVFQPETFSDWKLFMFEISARQLIQARLDLGGPAGTVNPDGRAYQVSLIQFSSELQYVGQDPFTWSAWAIRHMMVSYNRALDISNVEGATGVSIVGRSAGLCVDVPDANPADAVPVQQLTCGGPIQSNQKFNLLPAGGDQFKIVADFSGKCLDVTGASPDNGAGVQQYSCIDGQANQLWRLVPQGGQNYQVISVSSGKCLDVRDYGLKDGDLLQQWDCSGGANQSFYFSTQ